MLAVDEDRVLADLRTLAEFGKQGTGVSRPAFSDADLKARRWLADQMKAAGLDAVIDGIGTVYGRSPDAEQSILVGSHSDSVPNGGWLDGALGVIFGLELARAGRRSPGIGIDVISFADEEGTWLPCLGSRSFCGELAESALAGVQTKTGERLVDRLAQVGLGKDPLVRLDPHRHLAYLEAHIEQGPRLITEAINIGVVTGIVGIRSYIVRFRGRADHAGTTPMAKRRDAGFAAFGFATNLAERLRAAGSPDSVWNFGIVTRTAGRHQRRAGGSRAERRVSRPVPGRARAHERRVPCGAARRAKRRSTWRVSSAPTAALEPVAMDAQLIDLIAEAAAESGASHVRMPSGAGHDAMLLGRKIPAAMMFVPSIDGRSHDITENTDEADIRRGFRVFAAAAGKAIERLASKNGPPGTPSGRERERAS